LGGNHPKLPTARSTVKVRIEPETSSNSISQYSGVRPLHHWWAFFSEEEKKNEMLYKYV